MRRIVKQLRLWNALGICLVALLGSACLQENFYVAATYPKQGAEGVSRANAIVVSFIANSPIAEDQLSADFFSLEDLGKDYQPPASGAEGKQDTPSTGGTAPSNSKAAPQEEKNAETKKSENDKGAAKGERALNRQIPIAVYALAPSYGAGAQGKQVQFNVVISPLALMQPRHYYRLTVNKALEDGQENELLSDYTFTFKTGNTPEANKATLLRVYPERTQAAPATEEKQAGDTVVAAADKPAVSVGDFNAGASVAVSANQRFRLEFDAPIQSEEIKSALQIKRVGTASAVQDPVIRYHLILIDMPFESKRRLSSYIVVPSESLSGEFTLSYTDPKRATRHRSFKVDDKAAAYQPMLADESEIGIEVETREVVDEE